ncbi:hypothetical protein AB6A40_008786 [Gnathostoma spinigerum]|uniref:Uncharacterized protein n=1 Tax=Gnathostoma spinigerum TaxID=75299 RepID=A0ABD6ESG1_9BILA
MSECLFAQHLFVCCGRVFPTNSSFFFPYDALHIFNLVYHFLETATHIYIYLYTSVSRCYFSLQFVVGRRQRRSFSPLSFRITLSLRITSLCTSRGCPSSYVVPPPLLPTYCPPHSDALLYEHSFPTVLVFDVSHVETTISRNHSGFINA